MENILTLLTPKANVAFVNSNMTIRQGLEKLRAHGYAAIPVLNEDGTYCGVVSEGDFLWYIMKDNIVTVEELENIKVKDIIRRNITACKVDTTYDDLLKYIVKFNFVPIVDDRNILMGIITRSSVLNNLVASNN